MRTLIRAPLNGLVKSGVPRLSDLAQRERITLFNTLFSLHWEPADLIKDQVTNGHCANADALEA